MAEIGLSLSFQASCGIGNLKNSTAATMGRIAMAFAVALVATALGLGASIMIGSGCDPRMGYA